MGPASTARAEVGDRASGFIPDDKAMLEGRFPIPSTIGGVFVRGREAQTARRSIVVVPIGIVDAALDLVGVGARGPVDGAATAAGASSDTDRVMKIVDPA